MIESVQPKPNANIRVQRLSQSVPHHTSELSILNKKAKELKPLGTIRRGLSTILSTLFILALVSSFVFPLA